jgi:transcriptional regulator with XRE-family HTH domain
MKGKEKKNVKRVNVVIGLPSEWMLKTIWTKYVQSRRLVVLSDKRSPNMTTVKEARTFGELLRELREDLGLTLKNVSEQIAIDTSLLAKIERDERQPTKEILKRIALFFNVEEKDLREHFITDQIAYKILDEEFDVEILKVAEEKIKYLKSLDYGK